MVSVSNFLATGFGSLRHQNPDVSMKKALLNRHAALCMAIMVFGFLELTMPQNSHAVTLEELRTRLPKQFKGLN